MRRRYPLSQSISRLLPRTPSPTRLASRASLFIACGALFLVATRVQGDSIAIGQTLHEDVYISESSTFYYVSLPDAGTTFSVPKDDPAVGEPKITSDPDIREEIYERYKEARARLRVPDQAITVPWLGADTRMESTLSESDVGEMRSRSQAAARSTPLLELRGPPRPYVVAVPAGSRAPGPGVGSNAGRAGTPSFGAGTGSAGNRIGGGARGSGGAAGGGAGGGGAGRQNTARAGFSNISELFDTIDDAEVGETPNPIALGVGPIGGS